MEESMGTLSTVGYRPVLRFERRLNHPQAKVWKAVTDPAEMGHWFPASIETELRAGAPMRFSFGDDQFDLGGKFATGEVLEYDPPKVYAFRWVDDVLRFEIVPDGAGCKLLFTYALGDTGTHNDRPSVARTATGWDVCLSVLAARLDDREGPEVQSEWVLDRAERYVEQFGLGQGDVLDSGEGLVARFERDLVQPADQVWATLTEGTEPVAGESPPLRFTHGYVEAGAVTALDPPRMLEYAWHHDSGNTGRVRFELQHQEPLGCRLVLTQTLAADSPKLRATVLAAWQVHLELLFAALYGVQRCWPQERADALTATYAAQVPERR